MADSPTRVTLVHGTRAPDAAWIQPGSAMWQGLEDAGLVPEPFVWTGGNSHAARRRAATELTTRLRSAAEAGVPVAVVAHSHGGNIAAHAVWRLLKGGPRIPVVCLATPFLFARRRAVEPTVVVAAALAVLAVTLWSPFAIWAVATESGGWSAARVMLLLVCVLLLPPALVQIASWVVWRRAHGDPRSQEAQQRFVEQVQVPHCDDALLVVRAPDDEAGAVLAPVQLGSLVTTRVLAIARPGRWEGLVAVLFAVAALIGIVSEESMADAAAAAAAVAVSGLVLVAYACVAVPTLLGVLHGLDGPTAWFFANVTAEATPPGTHRVVQRELRALEPSGGRRAGGFLRRLIPSVPLAHSSLYDDPDVVREVVAHLCGRSRTV